MGHVFGRRHRFSVGAQGLGKTGGRQASNSNPVLLRTLDPFQPALLRTLDYHNLTCGCAPPLKSPLCGAAPWLVHLCVAPQTTEALCTQPSSGPFHPARPTLRHSLAHLWMQSCSICSFWCSRQELRSGCGGSHCHSCSAASPAPAPAPPTPVTPARPRPRSLGEGVRLGVPRGEGEAGEEEAGEEVEEEEEAGARARGTQGSQWLRRIALTNLRAPGNSEAKM